MFRLGALTRTAAGVACALLLAALGLLLGVWGAFLVPAGPVVGSATPLSIGVAVALVGNPGAAWLAVTLTRSRAGAMLPLLGWLVAAFPLAMSRPNGSIVLTGGGSLSLVSLLFLLAGLVAGLAASVLLPVPVASPGPPRGR
ncbi:MAG: DUF6113 family protein [Mycobacteriales bacterium]